MAEEVFKNIRVLRGIPVDEFMGTMGVFSAALGMSCEDCHSASDTTWENYALDTSPRKVTARRMVQMMASINQASFGGRQVVTCYTCHRGSSRPRVTPSLAALYGASRWKTRTTSSAPARRAAAADQILDKYIQALGGAQRLAGVTSFVAKGTRSGTARRGRVRSRFSPRRPDQRATIIHTLDGDNTTVYDGRSGWIAAPHKPVAVLALTGGELDGVGSKRSCRFRRASRRRSASGASACRREIDDKAVQVVQGTRRRRARDVLLRQRDGPAHAAGPLRELEGRPPAHADRLLRLPDVAGIKIPFRFKVTWLDGLENIELTDVQLNVPVDAARFGKPAPPRK